jgi:hypothetical protein
MALTFETMGNATIQFAVDDRVVLTTDPWLVGTCYFGSWALEKPLTPDQIRRACESEFIWLSHGHPDHLHPDSLAMMPRGKKILIPDHYDTDIKTFLEGEGFAVEVLKYRQWRRLDADVEVMCLDNENQDAILVVRLGDAPNDKRFILQLCSIDADMMNFVDAAGNSLAGPPEQKKPGAISAVARSTEWLGAKYFCCSSSQHIYVRADSIWGNPYRISWKDMSQYWDRPNVELVPPFVTFDVGNCSYSESQSTERTGISGGTGEDDWNAQLSEEEWRQVDAYVGKFDLLSRTIDFVEFSVGGVARRFCLNRRGSRPNASGVTFFCPRNSLMNCVTYGYFDDILIGNFMKTCLHGKASLYPNITPILAKLGGNAKVFTRRQHFNFLMRYLRRNPNGFFRWRLAQFRRYRLMPFLRDFAAAVHLFGPLKYVYRRLLLGAPLQK